MEVIKSELGGTKMMPALRCKSQLLDLLKSRKRLKEKEAKVI
jgi:hypothetical protein